MEAAYQLDYLCASLEQEEEVTDYFWMVWEIMFNIVKNPDVTSGIHEQLVNIVRCLQQCAKGDLGVWGWRMRQAMSNKAHCTMGQPPCACDAGASGWKV
ncbi:hypothetical protein F5884DRAFT_694089 [Xylogone sp. PMI_703]|nr:hypothetical protein F5884DRAFT_694089 [Xylogone sp. PMI_703]